MAVDTEGTVQAPVEGNFVTYVQTQLDPLEERPLCAVDSLALSWLVYFRLPAGVPEFDAARTWEGVPVGSLLLAERFDAMFGMLWDVEGSRDLLFALCSSPRFRGMRVAGFRSELDPEAEQQFAAATFLLPDGSAYVAFRGTDSTLVGWKEDFNLSFQCPVPSQIAARDYLDEAARELPGRPLFTGGHSKGGNLAVYAASECAPGVQERVVRAFSHDGPGFNEAFLRDGSYERIAGRIEKTLPRSSVIGMIFETQEDYAIVDSTSVALMQHNPFTWVVEGAAFREVEKLDAGARYLDRTIAEWVESVSPEERGRFIDIAFDVIGATEAERTGEISANWGEALSKMVPAAMELDDEARGFMLKILKALAKCAAAGLMPELSSRATENLRATLLSSRKEDA